MSKSVGVFQMIIDKPGLLMRIWDREAGQRSDYIADVSGQIIWERPLCLIYLKSGDVFPFS